MFFLCIFERILNMEEKSDNERLKMLGGVAWGEAGSGMQCCRDEKGKKMADKLPFWNQSQ